MFAEEKARDPAAKVLVVHGGAEGMTFFEGALAGMRLELVAAASVQKASEHLAAADIWVLLLDTQALGMDGAGSLKALRDHERAPWPSVILLTGQWSSEEDMHFGPELGPYDYLVKPFGPKLLRHKVGLLLEHQRRVRAIASLNRDLREQALALQAAVESLRKLNDSLEERVRERTGALEAHGRLLDRSNQDLSQFASLVAHDLQEPLRTLTGHLLLLKEDGAAAGLAENPHLERAQETARRMHRLVRELLHFSRVKASPDQAADVDCNELLKDVLDRLEASIVEKQAVIKALPLPQVSGHATLLRQLFQNLIENALKFRTLEPPQIEIGREERLGMDLFWVKDNGIGIAAADLEKIFLPFYRLHGPSEYMGTGMGLAWCKKIVELHGGRIWAEAAPAAGSTFFITLPRRRAVSPPTQEL